MQADQIKDFLWRANPLRMGAGRLPAGFWLAAFVPAYILSDWISFVHPVSSLDITPWNPPAALGVVLLMRSGLRYWPLLFVAALLSDIVIRGFPAPMPVLVAAALIVTAGYSAAAAVLMPWLKPNTTFEAPADLAIFMPVVTVASLAVAAGVVSLYTAAGSVPAQDLVANTMRFWIGDLNGILVFGPVLLVHGGPRNHASGQSLALWAEYGLQAASIAAALLVIFLVEEAFDFRFFSILFLPLIWISTRWGLRGATLALAGIELGLISVLQLGGYQSAIFIQLQFSMIALCVTGLVLGAVVSQRKMIEASLQEKQAALTRATQLAAAGEMASALAHDLNQPITALEKHLAVCESIISARDGPATPAGRSIAQAHVEARRASAVVHRIRDFYRGGASHVEAVFLAELVQNVIRSLGGRTEAAKIDVSFRRLPAITVKVDVLQIETALHNLLLNAIEAVPFADRGVRQIQISMEVEGGMAVVAIADSGPGIPPEVFRRLFEPFTTTKADGLGMGLAISRSFIQANGGELAASNIRGRGASFVMRLPCVKPEFTDD